MKRKLIFRHPAVQALLVSLFCILLGLLVGFIALLIINPGSAWEAITTILKNFLMYSRQNLKLKNLGNTLVKTAPLLMCSLSVLFAYKAGLFNIGAAGQYVVGAGACLYFGLAWHLPWYVCLIAAIAAGALLGVVSGALKAYCNVNEVISCIMLNWISLYSINTLLANVKESTSPYTIKLMSTSKESVIPTLNLGNLLFGKNTYTGLALIIAVAAAILIWFILGKTKLGYELKATGFNRNAARYCGMKEKQNLIMTMAISGALAGCGAALLYLTGFTEWSTTQSSVPAMGFNGIAAAFLGGLNPIGAIFSSFFIQHITDGGAALTTMGLPAQISDLISSLIIYLCSFVMFFKISFNRQLDRFERKHGLLDTTNVNAEPAKKADAEKGGKEA